MSAVYRLFFRPYWQSWAALAASALRAALSSSLKSATIDRSASKSTIFETRCGRD
jgi:hypothetical protein